MSVPCAEGTRSCLALVCGSKSFSAWSIDEPEGRLLGRITAATGHEFRDTFHYDSADAPPPVIITTSKNSVTNTQLVQAWSTSNFSAAPAALEPADGNPHSPVESGCLVGNSTGKALCGCRDGSLMLWDYGVQAPPDSFPEFRRGYALWEVKASASANMCLSCSTEGFLQLWDLRNHRFVRKMAAGEGIPISADMDEAGQVAVSGYCFDGSLELWDLGSGRRMGGWQDPANSSDLRDGIVDIHMHGPSGRVFLVESEEGYISTWTTDTLLRHPKQVGAEPVSRSDRHGHLSTNRDLSVVSIFDGHMVHVWKG